MNRTFSNLLRLVLSALPLAAGSASAAVPVAQQASGWTAARAADTAEAYTRFILENPDSPHVAEAEARLSTLDAVAVTLDTAQPAAEAERLGALSSESWSGSLAARLMNI
jgi:hypothetical protein